MKGIVLRLNSQHLFLKASHWGRLVTVAALSQIIVQAVGFLGGILLIRLLPTHEYALYILANTMVGTMAVLADGGISQGVIAHGGKVWGDREKLGVVLATGLDLRLKFGLASLCIALPALFFLLATHGATVLTSLFIALAIVPIFFSTLSGSLLQIAPKLQQDILPLQKNQVTANLIRLLLLCVSIFLFPFAGMAILAAGIPQLWANVRLKRISLPYTDWTQRPDAEVRKELLKFVKRILPGSIYFCLSGQITIWLISFFGSATAIAQVGALGRLAIVLTLFNIMVNLLVTPRFARLAEERMVLLEWFGRIQAYLILFSVMMTAVVWAFPGQVLWILGSKYAGLESELVLCFIGSCLNLMVGMNYTLNTSRGWLLSPVIVIGVGLAGIVIGIQLVDISTLRGVLVFNIFTGVVGLFIHPLFGFLKIIRCKAVRTQFDY